MIKISFGDKDVKAWKRRHESSVEQTRVAMELLDIYSKRLKKRDDIIKDFMTTKEDLQTWRDEMYVTVCEVVGEDI